MYKTQHDQYGAFITTGKPDVAKFDEPSVDIPLSGGSASASAPSAPDVKDQPDTSNKGGV
jgi:hypothetical protein